MHKGEILMKKILTNFLTLTLILATFAFTACSGFSPKEKTFCEIVSQITGEEVKTPSESPYYITIGSDDSYCEIDTNPYDIDDYSSSTAMRYIKDMNTALGLPEYLYNDMIHTSYSQGKQEETFGNIKVKYYYHPDKGLNVSYYRI